MNKILETILLLLILIITSSLSGNLLTPDYFHRDFCPQKAIHSIEIIALYDLGLFSDIPWGISLVGDSFWFTDVVSDPWEVCSLKQYNIPMDTLTGVIWDVSDVGYSRWIADMTYDSANGYIWCVSVGGTDFVYAIDPETGIIEDTLYDPDSNWTDISQRGIGYDPENDIFYIGGWNRNRIYKVKGKTWANDGEIIDSFPANNCAGIGWDRVTETIWFCENEEKNTIFQLHATTGAVLCSLEIEWCLPYSLAGLEIADDGTIWFVDMNQKIVYYISSPLRIEEIQTPHCISLSAYPNPFNSAVTISFDGVGAGSPVPIRAEIYDLAGRKISDAEPVEAGAGMVTKDNSTGSVSATASLTCGDLKFIWRPDPSLPSGVYLVRARFGQGGPSTGSGSVVSKRVVYLK